MELDGLMSTVMPLPAVTLTFDLSIPKANQHSYESKYIRDQNLVKFPSLVFEIWCSQGFLDAQTHSLTDGQTWIQNASSTVFQRWRMHKDLDMISGRYNSVLSTGIVRRLETMKQWGQCIIFPAHSRVTDSQTLTQKKTQFIISMRMKKGYL